MNKTLRSFIVDDELYPLLVGVTYRQDVFGELYLQKNKKQVKG